MARALVLRVWAGQPQLIGSRRRARACVLLCVLVVCLAQRSDSAPKRVEFLRAPHYLTDETTVAFQLRIQPHEDNRGFLVAAIDEVGNTARSSAEDLPGPTTRLIEWEPLGAGDYELVARVFGEGGKQLAQDRSHLTVLAWRGP